MVPDFGGCVPKVVESRVVHPCGGMAAGLANLGRTGWRARACCELLGVAFSLCCILAETG